MNEIQEKTETSTVAESRIHTRILKRKKRKKNIWIILFCVLVVITIRFFLSGGVQKDANISYIGDIPVICDYLPKDAAARTGIKREIKYIVMHETANKTDGADAAAHNSFIHKNGQTQELSWHYTVDDHAIYHHIPDDEAAFHAGDHLNKNGGNLNGIGIEMCVNVDGDFEKTLDNAAQLAATLLHEYGLSVQDVRKHQDFSGKMCPLTLIESGRWHEFVGRVQTAYDAYTEEMAESDN